MNLIPQPALSNVRFSQYLRGVNGLGTGVPVLGPSIQTGAAAGGAIAAAILAPGVATWGALAVPVVGAAIAGVLLAVNLFLNRMGPKQKVWTTQIANEAEQLLQRNLDAWNNSDKYVSEQQVALANFDAIWNMVLEKCGDPKMGEPGERCINERKEGGVAPWCPKPGGVGCDWFILYRRPISDDPELRADPTNTVASVSETVTNVSDSIGSSIASTLGLTGQTAQTLGRWFVPGLIGVLVLVMVVGD